MAEVLSPAVNSGLPSGKEGKGLKIPSGVPSPSMGTGAHPQPWCQEERNKRQKAHLEVGLFPTTASAVPFQICVRSVTPVSAQLLLCGKVLRLLFTWGLPLGVALTTALLV